MSIKTRAYKKNLDRDTCMYACMHACMYVCMYVYIYVYIYFRNYVNISSISAQYSVLQYK